MRFDLRWLNRMEKYSSLDLKRVMIMEESETESVKVTQRDNKGFDDDRGKSGNAEKVKEKLRIDLID